MNTVEDGMHTEFCAVCNSKLEYSNYESYMGDCDMADCEECGTGYCEGYINDEETDVPTLQQAYLHQIMQELTKPERRLVAEQEEFIRRQLGLLHGSRF